ETHTYQFRKDFKLSGQIGDAKFGLSFTSYMRQVKTAISKGYSDHEVVEAVIRAITPGNRLRNYLESREGLDIDTLNSIIRSYYKELTPTELYQQLCGLSQDHNESPQDFLFRALDIRQKVLFASGEECADVSYDLELVQTMFRRSLSTGIRDDIIRSEFAVTLAKKDVSDEELVTVMNTITGRAAERQHKIEISKKSTPHGVQKTAKVAEMDVGKVTEPKVVKEGVLQTELRELRAEVMELKRHLERPPTPMNSNLNRTGQPEGHWKTSGNGWKPGCHQCQQAGTGESCRHCWKCGSIEHFKRGCRWSGNATGLQKGGNL
ncbi:MAG: hypothetical protein ABW185_04755, partial [Sedimenticola sp.]